MEKTSFVNVSRSNFGIFLDVMFHNPDFKKICIEGKRKDESWIELALRLSIAGNRVKENKENHVCGFRLDDVIKEVFCLMVSEYYFEDVIKSRFQYMTMERRNGTSLTKMGEKMDQVEYVLNVYFSYQGDQREFVMKSLCENDHMREDIFRSEIHKRYGGGGGGELFSNDIHCYF